LREKEVDQHDVVLEHVGVERDVVPVLRHEPPIAEEKTRGSFARARDHRHRGIGGSDRLRRRMMAVMRERTRARQQCCCDNSIRSFTGSTSRCTP
jgi:hypothetical protein